MSELRIEGLGLELRGLRVLRDLSLTVRAGTVLGLVGESGSGKSMTALSVMGLLPRGARTTGRVRLGGRDLIALSEAEMCAVRGRDIGMIFQEPMTALNPLQTIGDQVAETVRIHGAAGRARARAIARETLDRVGLPAASFPLGRYPHQLSGGQRQRVGIAMAIALRPKLLIADEPTTALDVTTQAQILALLRRLVAEDGMTCLLITHDLAVVAEMADQVAVLKRGAVVEAGLTAEVLRRMRHRDASAPAAARPPARVPRTPVPLLAVDGAMRTYAAARRDWFSPTKPFSAVKGLSFAIGEGENLGLVGESGSGKSTLARAILGLEALQGGSIRIDGVQVAAGGRPDRSQRARVQAVFQDPYGSFNPCHRVARLVAEPFHLIADAPKGAARLAAVEHALTDVGLAAEDAQKYIHEFSGGQRQRIAIARALIIRPRLVILDEAVSALDTRVRMQILDLLARLSARLGVSYLFISHDLGVVRAITDRVLVMYQGEIVEAGATRQVFEAPQHAYTRALLAAAPALDLSA